MPKLHPLLTGQLNADRKKYVDDLFRLRPTKGQTSISTVVEAVVLASIQSAIASRGASVTESVNATSSQSAVANFVASITETVSAISTQGYPGSASIVVILCTDIIDGPKTGGQSNNGAFVTLYGIFGSAGSVTLNGAAVASIILWSSNRIIVQLGAGVSTGNFTVTNGTGESSTGVVKKAYGGAASADFTVRAGVIQFVSLTGTSGDGSYTNPYSPSQLQGAIGSGKITYFRGGTYTSVMNNGWNVGNISLSSSHSGSAYNTTAFLAYPNETVQLSGQPVCLWHRYGATGDSSGTDVAHYIALCNMRLIATGSSVIGTGGVANSSVDFYPKSGAHGCRYVGNVSSCLYDFDTHTGIMVSAGDDNSFLCNVFKETGTYYVSGSSGTVQGYSPTKVPKPINTNHAMYVQLGSSNCQVCYNEFHSLSMGWVIQNHTDGLCTYLNVDIDGNYIHLGVNGNCRGITCSDALSGSVRHVRNNLLVGVGQGVHALRQGSGTVYWWNNTLVNINGGGIEITCANLPIVLADVRNNIFKNISGVQVDTTGGSANGGLTLGSNLIIDYNVTSDTRDTHRVTTDPLFVNEAGLDYHLQSGSPARDSGVAVTNPTDKEGTARTGTMDRGAYAYNSPLVEVKKSTASVLLFHGGGWSPATAALASVAAGNLFVSIMGGWDANQVAGSAQQAPTDSNGTLAVAIAPVLAGASNPIGWTVGARIDYIASAAAGTHTVTPPNLGTDGDGFLITVEFSAPGATWTKVDQGSALVGSATAGAVDGITVTTAGTAAQAGDLVLAVVLTDGNPTAIGVGGPSGYPNTILTSPTASDNIALGAGWKPATASGAQSATWAWADSACQVAVAVIAVFRRT